MFKSISWQDYLTGIAIVLGAYYVVSALLLYSKDAYRRFSLKQSNPEQPEGNLTRSTSTVMGGIKQDPPKKNELSVEAQDLIIGEGSESTLQNDDLILVGPVSDLLHEVKVLTRVIKESGGSKDEGAPMFQSLLSNYPHLVETKYQESISVFIHQHCSSEAVFEVDLAEIKSWWPVQESQNNQNNSEV